MELFFLYNLVSCLEDYSKKFKLKIFYPNFTV